MSGSTTGPSLAGFVLFVAQQMGVPNNVLPPTPSTCPVVQNAYNVATEIANDVMSGISSLIYTLMIYNLAGHNLIEFAQDVAPSNFWATLRSNYGVTAFTFGTTSSSSDNGSSTSLQIPDYYKNLSLAEYQYTLTPYGRQYLALASRYGSVWGIT